MNKDIDHIDMDNVKDEVVKKRKSNGKNSPVIGDNGYMTAPGDNSKAISQIMGIYNMPKIDINSDEAVEKRIQEYFEYCFGNDLKPGVEGMALAIGVDRRTLWDWETGRKRGELGSSRSDIIKKGKMFLANYLEYLGQNGKINPVTFIFLMKNHNGYTDKQEIEIAPKSQLGDAVSPEEIQSKLSLVDNGSDADTDF